MTEPSECRICHDAENQSDMITPCKCAGSMKYIHRACLEKWRATNLTAYKKCNECQTVYIQEVTPLNSFPFKQFMSDEFFQLGCIALSYNLLMNLAICYSFEIGYIFYLVISISTTVSMLGTGYWPGLSNLKLSVMIHNFYDELNILFIAPLMLTGVYLVAFLFNNGPSHPFFFGLSIAVNVMFFPIGIRRLKDKINTLRHYSVRNLE
ncbi:MAG: hypothetical protein Hyperionvirus5_71 [Hyperionvirus sp.]|uniref:E3 ubiquitin-protein ligase LAP n=1 Tax=Hyperionvirus sp. TaxID=2487770 RepID=A0A3G5A7Q8_9VIRU|nr:MAG: hypothetical protein Hyperionvirus5_71 [Hyperionvirus sp.]